MWTTLRKWSSCVMCGVPHDGSVRERERERRGYEEGWERGGSILPFCPIQDSQLAKWLSTPASCQTLLVCVPSFMSAACVLAGSFNLLDFSLSLKLTRNQKSQILSERAGSWSRLQCGRESLSARSPYREASPAGLSYPTSCSTGGKCFPSMKQAWDKNIFENGQSKQHGIGPVDSTPLFEHLQR